MLSVKPRNASAGAEKLTGHPHPDVVIMDLFQPELAASRRPALSQLHPTARVVCSPLIRPGARRLTRLRGRVLYVKETASRAIAGRRARAAQGHDTERPSCRQGSP